MAAFCKGLSLKVIGKISLDDLCDVFKTLYDYSGELYVKVNVTDDDICDIRNEYRLYVRHISKMERRIDWSDEELWSGSLIVSGFLEIDGCLSFVLECLGYDDSDYQTELLKYELIYNLSEEGGEIKLSFVDYEEAEDYYKSVLMLLQNKRNEE